jgi:hypothetical protein
VHYGGAAVWRTALADAILGYVAQMLKLKLLLGWGLALEDALADEIRNVVHYVFVRPAGRCAVCTWRQSRRRSLRNNSSVLGCGVHALAGAAFVLGLEMMSDASRYYRFCSFKARNVYLPKAFGSTLYMYGFFLT